MRQNADARHFKSTDVLPPQPKLQRLSFCPQFLPTPPWAPPRRCSLRGPLQALLRLLQPLHITAETSCGTTRNLQRPTKHVPFPAQHLEWPKCLGDRAPPSATRTTVDPNNRNLTEADAARTGQWRYQACPKAQQKSLECTRARAAPPRIERNTILEGRTLQAVADIRGRLCNYGQIKELARHALAANFSSSQQRASCWRRSSPPPPPVSQVARSEPPADNAPLCNKPIDDLMCLQMRHRCYVRRTSCTVPCHACCSSSCTCARAQRRNIIVACPGFDLFLARCRRWSPRHMTLWPSG